MPEPRACTYHASSDCSCSSYGYKFPRKTGVIPYRAKTYCTNFICPWGDCTDPACEPLTYDRWICGNLDCETTECSDPSCGLYTCDTQPDYLSLRFYEWQQLVYELSDETPDGQQPAQRPVRRPAYEPIDWFMEYAGDRSLHLDHWNVWWTIFFLLIRLALVFALLDHLTPRGGYPWFLFKFLHGSPKNRKCKSRFYYRWRRLKRGSSLRFYRKLHKWLGEARSSYRSGLSVFNNDVYRPLQHTIIFLGFVSQLIRILFYLVLGEVEFFSELFCRRFKGPIQRIRYMAPTPVFWRNLYWEILSLAIVLALVLLVSVYIVIKFPG